MSLCTVICHYLAGCAFLTSDLNQLSFRKLKMVVYYVILHLPD